MEPEGSSPYSQVPATCPYPEPTPSSLHPLPLPEDPSYKLKCYFLKIRFNIILHQRSRTVSPKQGPAEHPYWFQEELMN